MTLLYNVDVDFDVDVGVDVEVNVDMLPHPKMLSMQEDLRQCARSTTKAMGQLLQSVFHYKVMRLMMIRAN